MSRIRWSYELGRIGGIPINVHLTFLLLLLFEALTEGSLAGVLFTVAVFGVVVLHELGHAFAARGFGIRTREITLLPIGGVARLERMPSEPFQELVVALAGPGVNALLALLSLGALGLVSYVPWLGLATPFLVKLLWVNAGLGLFNLVPAFPMDGGRVLRALLAMRMGFGRATRVAARTGRWFGVAFALLGIFVSPMLLLIAAFVWLAGRSEEWAASGGAPSMAPRYRPRVAQYRIFDSEGRVIGVYVHEPSDRQPGA